MKGRAPIVKAVAGSLTRVPAMPSHLPKIMRKEWNAACRDLIERGILTEVFVGHVASYIFAEWQVRTFAAEAAKRPFVTVKGKRRASPAFGLLNKSQELKARYAAELGLTPAARARRGMVAETESEQENRDDAANLGL